jgi:hypothetical protein
MIQTYNELQAPIPTQKYIKHENETYYYYYFPTTQNIELDIAHETKKLIKQKLAQLATLRDSKLSHSTVTYKELITRVREKDITTLSSLALIGGTYIFENGTLELTTTQAKELLKLINNKRTEIIQWKQAQESRIKSMELMDLYYLNVNLM